MSRDVMYQYINENQKLAVTTDCSGSCGELSFDDVKISNEMLAYFTARVALMEILSVRAKLIGYTVSNMTRGGYKDLHRGIKKALEECNVNDVANISSTEKNFQMVQTAIGITFMGIVDVKEEIKTANEKCQLEYGVIGKPLVGNEVLEEPQSVISLKLFSQVLEDPDVVEILPVGSKGIKYEFEHFFKKDVVKSDVDIKKSAGPATCVIVSFHKDKLELIKDKYELFILQT